jgi:transposase-like protein
MRARRRTRGEWEQIISELLASGQTTARFAEQQGLHPGTTAYWRAKLGREARSLPTPQAVGGFVEVVTGGTAACELRLQWGDLTLEFRELPPTDWLAALLERC